LRLRFELQGMARDAFLRQFHRLVSGAAAASTIAAGRVAQPAE
jgi:hypothetical protein